MEENAKFQVQINEYKDNIFPHKFMDALVKESPLNVNTRSLFWVWQLCDQMWIEASGVQSSPLIVNSLQTHELIFI